MSAAEPDTAGIRSRRLRSLSSTSSTASAAPASGSATNNSTRSASVRPGPGATRYQSSSGTRLRSGSNVPSMTHRSGTAWARWKSFGSISTIFWGGLSDAGGGGGGGSGGGGSFLHAYAAASRSAARPPILRPAGFRDWRRGQSPLLPIGRTAKVYRLPALALCEENSRKKSTIPAFNARTEVPSSAKSADSSHTPPQLSQVS